MHHFFAYLFRMKNIKRWGLMRSLREEDLEQHSLEVAVLAHALALIRRDVFGKTDVDPEHAAAVALYHDASEIITGDMPTPVKYFNANIRNAYKDVESIANERLLSQLPEDLRPAYQDIFHPDKSGEDALLHRLVKAADKLSALIKCIEEERSGNQEFRSAKESTERSLKYMAEELPEVRDFLRDFLPSYGKTLDELT